LYDSIDEDGKLRSDVLSVPRLVPTLYRWKKGGLVINPSVGKTYCPKRDVRLARIEKRRAPGMASLDVDGRADSVASSTHMKGWVRVFL